MGVKDEEEKRVIRPRTNAGSVSSSDSSNVTLRTDMSTVVFVDRRSREQLQLLSCGHPMVRQCSSNG